MSPKTARVAYQYLMKRAFANLSKDQEHKLRAVLEAGKGKPIPDDKIHALAEEFKMSPHVLESYIYGIASKAVGWVDSPVNPGGQAEAKGVTEKDFPAKTLEKGIKVELEHTEDKDFARRVVLDHLAEFPDYYDALDKMEKGLEKKAWTQAEIDRHLKSYEEDVWPAFTVEAVPSTGWFQIHTYIRHTDKGKVSGVSRTIRSYVQENVVPALREAGFELKITANMSSVGEPSFLLDDIPMPFGHFTVSGKIQRVTVNPLVTVLKDSFKALGKGPTTVEVR